MLMEYWNARQLASVNNLIMRRKERNGQDSAWTHHKELAERDVREDVVRLVLPAQLLRLLPEVRELLC